MFKKNGPKIRPSSKPIEFIILARVTYILLQGLLGCIYKNSTPSKSKHPNQSFSDQNGAHYSFSRNPNDVHWKLKENRTRDSTRRFPAVGNFRCPDLAASPTLARRGASGSRPSFGGRWSFLLRWPMSIV